MLKKMRAALCLLLIVSMLMSGVAMGEEDYLAYNISAQTGETQERLLVGGANDPDELGLYSITSSDKSVVTVEFFRYTDYTNVSDSLGPYCIGFRYHAHNPGTATITAEYGIYTPEDFGEWKWYNYSETINITVRAPNQPLEVSLSSNAPYDESKESHLVKLVDSTWEMDKLAEEWFPASKSPEGKLGVDLFVNLAFKGIVANIGGPLIEYGLNKANINLEKLSRATHNPNPLTMTVTVTNPNNFDVTNAYLDIAPERGSAYASLKTVSSDTGVVFTVPANGSVTKTYTITPEYTYNSQHYSYSVDVQAHYTDEDGNRVSSEEESLPFYIHSGLYEKNNYYDSMDMTELIIKKVISAGAKTTE